MIKIYRESLGYFVATLPTLLILAAAIEVLIWVLQPKHESSGTVAAYIFLAYFFHRHFLFGEAFGFRNRNPVEGAPPFKFGWFFLVTAALTLATTGIAVALALGYLDRTDRGGMILIYFPVYLVILSLFGLALPATVARDKTFRVMQGIRATFSTMWRLVLGPGVVGFALIVAAFLADKALASFGIAEDSLLVLAFNILARTLGFLTTIFAVAVLCEIYRRTRPEPGLSEGPVTPDQTPA